MLQGQGQGLDRLYKALDGHVLTPFVGAGFSAAVSGDNPCATWHGLLRNGIGVCANEVSEPWEGWAEAKEAELEKGGADTLLPIAENIRILFRKGGTDKEFKSWIEATAGSLEPTEEGRRIVGSVCALGGVIVTTNYDSLITQSDSAWQRYTWADDDFPLAFGRSQVVLHLHGGWWQPESIILCSSDYQRMSDDRRNQILSDSLFITHRFIFIGCGDGLNDPHIAPLLKDIMDHTPHSGSEHFILVVESDYQRMRRELPDLITPVTYGKSHQELPKFLEELANRKLGKASEATGSQPAPPYGSNSSTDTQGWLTLAAHAHQKLTDALELLDRAEDAMRQVRRRSVLPPGLDTSEYPYQTVKHKNIADSLVEPANLLKANSARIASTMEDAAGEIWDLAGPRFDVQVSRLAPIIHSVSELADISGGLLASSGMAADDLSGRTIWPGYKAPVGSLAEARASFQRAHEVAVSLQDRLSQQQASQASGPAGPPPSAASSPVTSLPRTSPPVEPSKPRLVPTEQTGWADSEVRLVPVKADVGASSTASAVTADGSDEDGEYLALPARYVRGEDAIAARVRGDSMKGSGVFEGDYIVMVPEPEPTDGEMVVVVAEGIEGDEIRVKWLRLKDPDTIRLESSKRGEPAVELPLDTVQQIYRVVAVLRWDVGKQARGPR
jgi:SOS-response transcriptional repressor LexA